MKAKKMSNDKKPEKINSRICSSCGGACCKSVPGIYAPSDFGHSHGEILKNVALAFERGEISLDCWEGEWNGGPSLHYVRPRVVQSLDKRVDYTWGGVCMNLTPNGCSLDYEKRPMQCRELIPSEEHGYSCTYINSSYTKHGMAKRWKLLSEKIKQIAYSGENDDNTEDEQEREVSQTN